jgi:hypothetical protein
VTKVVKYAIKLNLLGYKLTRIGKKKKNKQCFKKDSVFLQLFEDVQLKALKKD